MILRKLAVLGCLLSWSCASVLPESRYTAPVILQSDLQLPAHPGYEEIVYQGNAQEISPVKYDVTMPQKPPQEVPKQTYRGMYKGKSRVAQRGRTTE